jgi:hypothetical protein
MPSWWDDPREIQMNGRYLRDHPAVPGVVVMPQGGAPMMNTGVLTGTRGNSASGLARLCMRMQPWDA